MFTENLPLESLIRIAGAAQLALVLASSAIPRALNWRTELANVSDLMRRHFYVYAAYIMGTNLAIGLLSTIAPITLLDGSTLSAVVCGFITTYWGARLVIQFACFRGVERPTGRIYDVAEWILVALFVFLTFTYGSALLSRW